MQPSFHSPPPTRASVPVVSHAATLARPARAPSASTPWLPTGKLGPMSIKRVGIVGSGIMGSGIAEVAAAAGYEVVLRSRSQADGGRHGGRPGEVAGQAGGEGQADRRRGGRDHWPRVAPRRISGALADVDLVIESVIEDLAVKKDLFAELDSICQDGTILATNTSTLPVVELAMATGPARPGVRHPLLQPGAGHGARRGGAPDHRRRRHRRRRHARSPPPAARTPWR